MATLDDTDAPFTSGSPLLSLFEPALFLPPPSLLATRARFGIETFSRLNPPHLLQFAREVTRVNNDPFRNPAYLTVIGGYSHGRRQPTAESLARRLALDFVVRDDLMLRFLT